MDGLICYFTRLHEVEAFEAAKQVIDPYLALFGLLLTEEDIEFLHHQRVWGIDARR